MLTSSKHIFLIFLVLMACVVASCGDDKDTPLQPESNKAERNFIRQGNKLFADENYADAEVEYSKALQANPGSAVAAYNMGLAIAKQAAAGDSTGALQRADSLFSYAASITPSKQLKMMAHYNKGNLAYNAQQYDRAIEDYKNALRAVPTDEDSRYNLRMAQLKQQEQQQQQQDKNNQDQNENQDKDKHNQDQNNQDNQDKNQQDKNDQQQGQDQQGQNQQGNQDKANPEQGKQDQQQGGQGNQQGQPINMDERSVQQVLKAMQDKEKQTQQRIYQMGERQRESERRATRNKW